MKKFLALALSFSLTIAVQAANTGFDKASDPVYGTWDNGDNGGSGFGAWVLSTTSGDSGQNGFFVASSSGNAGGSSGNIDTAGVSWGMYANSGQTASAVRPLTGGSLLVGQKITLSIDNGFIQNGGSEGFGLQTSGGSNRLEFFFTGGSSNYTYVDSTGSHDSGVGFTGNGLSFAFTLTGVDTYSLAVTPNGSGTTTLNGTLSGAPGSGIDQLRFFNFNGGSGSDANFYANLLTVPEPSTYAAGALPLLGLLFFRRRKTA